MGTIVHLKKVRIAFIDNLFKPSQYEGQGDYRHSATFIVDPGSENDKALQAAIAAEASAVWGKKAESFLEDMRTNKNKFSYIKNKKDKSGEVYEGFKDKYALSAIRKQKDGSPLFLHNIKDRTTGKAKHLTGEEGVIYAGAYVNAKVEIWAQSGTYSGIRAGLLGVQFDSPGDSFGGASRPTEDGFDSLDAPEDDLA